MKRRNLIGMCLASLSPLLSSFKFRDDYPKIGCLDVESLPMNTYAGDWICLELINGKWSPPKEYCIQCVNDIKGYIEYLPKHIHTDYDNYPREKCMVKKWKEIDGVFCLDGYEEGSRPQRLKKYGIYRLYFDDGQRSPHNEVYRKKFPMPKDYNGKLKPKHIPWNGPKSPWV